jgi:hypothetical protein
MLKSAFMTSNGSSVAKDAIGDVLRDRSRMVNRVRTAFALLPDKNSFPRNEMLV